MLNLTRITDSDLSALLAGLPPGPEYTPPVFCDEAVHEHLRRTPIDMLNLRPWPSAGLEIGECPGCGTTLAIEVGQ